MTDSTTQEALERPGMFWCEPLRARIHERQCLVNQRKHRVSGRPFSCDKDCLAGGEIRDKHPGAKLPDFQHNAFHGGRITTRKEQATLDAPVQENPAKRIAKEKRAQLDGRTVCKIHKISLLLDKRNRPYCSACRRERLRKNIAPKCEVHGVARIIGI